MSPFHNQCSAKSWSFVVVPSAKQIRLFPQFPLNYLKLQMPGREGTKPRGSGGQLRIGDQVLVPRLRNGGVQVPALGSSLCSGINKPLVQVGGMEVTELWVLSIAWNQGSILGGFCFGFF